MASKGKFLEATKLKHFTRCVTFSVAGHKFEPLIILPNKKKLKSLEELNCITFCHHQLLDGIQKKLLFTHSCVLLEVQLSLYSLQHHYKLTLPENIRNERILLLVNGHPSRSNYKTPQ